MKKLILNSILAGIMIAIGSAVFLNTADPVYGAFFFSVGLLSILWFGFNLYTGKIGYVRNGKMALDALIILIFNFVGCCIMLTLPLDGSALMAKKLALPLWQVFFKGVLCGILIYIAVDRYKQGQWYATLFAVPAFILCGAEHCIADFCYMLAGRTFSLEAILFLAVVTLGNSVGSILFSLCIDYNKKS